jgi:ZIP family zinc transporter
MNNIMFAFLLTLLAGLSTGIGSGIALFAKKTNTKFLSVSLGFSAGVMIYVSLIELFAESRELLSLTYGDKTGLLITIMAFFGSMLLIAAIDKLIPSEKNPHEFHHMPEGTTPEQITSTKTRPDAPHPNHRKLMRTGLLTAMVISIHNFPEGLATFVAALQAPMIAIPIFVAIAIHNIPEGIAVSVPIYYATGNKKKAFLYSFASGLTEPLGALIGYLILMPFLTDTVYGILFAVIAGIMVFISVDELLPAAREYGEHHLSIYGLLGGMFLMALSLWLFV